MEVQSITFLPRHTRLTVRFRHHLYSGQLPELANSLLRMLPQLREHLCYNRNGVPFIEELYDTELGHVFEHVILEILRRRGLHLRGQTTWNWHRDPLGTYNVTINTGKKLLVKESLLVAQAMFTNALLGPVLRFHLPASSGSKPAAQPLAVHISPAKEPSRLLFSADQSEFETVGSGSPDLHPTFQPALIPKHSPRKAESVGQ